MYVKCGEIFANELHVSFSKVDSFLQPRNKNSGCWGPRRVCAVTTSFHDLCQLDRRIDKGASVESCKMNRLLFVGDLVLLT